MKIALVVPADFIGGAELFAVELAKYHRDLVVIHSGNPQFSKLLPSITQQVEMNFPRLKNWSPMSLWRYWQTSAELQKILSKIEPDIVLSNSVRTHLLSARALRDSVVPLVFFVHDFTFPAFFLQFAAPRANKIYACSRAVKHDLLSKGVGSAKIKVFYNGVDLERFNKKKRLEADKLRVGIIGRLDPWKGQDLFLRAAEQLPKLNFYIYGESSEYDPQTVVFEQKLQEWVIPNVWLKGFVPAEKALRELDILVHASKKQEPLGRVVLEAMAAGVPVISTNEELVQDGINGLLIPRGNLDCMVRQITKLAENHQLRLELKLNARQCVEENFDLQKTMQKLLQSLGELCK